jgi:hypothetical protein
MEATLWTEPVREGREGARLAVHISLEGRVGRKGKGSWFVMAQWPFNDVEIESKGSEVEVGRSMNGAVVLGMSQTEAN